MYLTLLLIELSVQSARRICITHFQVIDGSTVLLQPFYR